MSEKEKLLFFLRHAADWVRDLESSDLVEDENGEPCQDKIRAATRASDIIHKMANKLEKDK